MTDGSEERGVLARLAEASGMTLLIIGLSVAALGVIALSAEFVAALFGMITGA